ncbi:MAG: four helix bundle protein [Thermomicrobiales bacterium]
MESGAAEVKDFTDLRVWRGAMELAEEVYRLTWTFPKQEQYGLSNQLQRAAVSVPSNIAEGHGRSQSGEYVRFLNIARGSLAEIKTQLILATRLGYTTEPACGILIVKIDDLRRQIGALRTAIERHNGR